MPLVLNREKALIFRITHRDNVPWILDNGMRARNGNKPDPNFRAIGNPDLIGKRSGRSVEVPPGGTLSDYVPFYFTPYSIMMLNILTGRNVQKVQCEEIVIFVSSLPRITAEGVPFVFTNQHAFALNAEYFTDLDDLERIDWPLLQSRDFKHDPDDPEKKERYQAEALVWRQVPVSAFHGICCYTEPVAVELRAEVQARGLSLQVAAQRSWYF